MPYTQHQSPAVLLALGTQPQLDSSGLILEKHNPEASSGRLSFELIAVSPLLHPLSSFSVPVRRRQPTACQSLLAMPPAAAPWPPPGWALFDVNGRHRGPRSPAQPIEALPLSRDESRVRPRKKDPWGGAVTMRARALIKRAVVLPSSLVCSLSFFFRFPQSVHLFRPYVCVFSDITGISRTTK